MIRHAFILAFGIFLLTQSAVARDFVKVPIPTDSEIHKMLADWANRRQANIGIVVGIISPEGRRIVACGKFNENDPRPLGGDTVYEIGSITKVFTSLLLADMVRHGEVALTDPVARYLPKEAKVPGRHGRVITLEDLSRHRSGLPRMPLNFPPINPKDAYRSYSPNDLYRFLSFYPLPRDIGAEFEYSNLGVGMLGYALSLAANKSYEELLRTRILTPLGMSDTAITLSPDMQARFVPGYDMWFERGANWDIGQVFAPAGGLRSTANDLLAFLSAQMDIANSPLGPAIALTQSHWQPTDSGGSVGLGWFKFSVYGKNIISHDGATGSYCAFAGFDLEAKTAVVILTNVQTPVGEATDIGFRLLGLAIRPSPPWSLITIVGVIAAALVTSQLRRHKTAKIVPAPDPAGKNRARPLLPDLSENKNYRLEEPHIPGAVPRPVAGGEMLSAWTLLPRT